MPTFEVRFYKDICDPTGHQHRVLQRAVRVDAADAAAALDVAKGAFCAQERIVDWTIHADGFDLRVLTAERGSPRAAGEAVTPAREPSSRW